MKPTALLLATVLAQPTPAIVAPVAAPRIMRGADLPSPPEEVVGDAATLPISFKAGLPTLEVKINQKGPFKVGFDTGAPGGPHLAPHVADELQLEPAGELMAGDPSGRNARPVKLYRLDAISFGAVTAKNWTGSVEQHLLGKADSLDGVVGLDAFPGYVVTIDYPHARFSLRRGALPDANGRTVFSYGGDMAPSVPLTLEGRSIAADVDTGNTVSGIILPADFAEGLKHKAEARTSGVAHTVSSTVQMFSVPIEGRAWVGTTPLAISTVGYPSIIPIANIGSPALVHTVVEIDPAHKRIRLSGSN